MIKKDREALAAKIRNLDPSEDGRIPIPSDTLGEVAQAFAEMDKNRQQQIADHPVAILVAIHTAAQTPEDQTICGVHTTRVTLGDLRSLLDMVR